MTTERLADAIRAVMAMNNMDPSGVVDWDAFAAAIQRTYDRERVIAAVRALDDGEPGRRSPDWYAALAAVLDIIEA